MLGTVGINNLKYLLLLVLLCFVMGAGQSGNSATDLEQREEMTLRMVQFARAGRIEEARDVLKAYLHQNPNDGTMYYNLTCLDLLFDEKEQALQDLRHALENGYTNFRLIQVDTDLDRLRDDPRFETMWTSFEDAFLVNFQDRALYLDDGYVSEKISLNFSNAEVAHAPMAAPEITVKYDADALHVSVLVEDPNYSPDNAPWENGCGILVNLIQPLSPEDYESRYYYSYGFHMSDGAAQATLVGKHGEILLQEIHTLSPSIMYRDDTVHYEVSIPWESFKPYGPPLDQELGINVFYFGQGQGTSRPIFSLMAEKRASFEADPWRRYVPLYLMPSDRSVPSLRGRLYDRLCASGDLGIQFAHWSANEGDGKFRFTIHSQTDPEKSMIAPILETELCEEELNFYNFYLNMAELPEGSYYVRAELENPSGEIFTGEYPFDNFEAGWISSLNERVHKIKTAEQSILKYHLFNMTRDVEKRLAQTNAIEFHAKYAGLVQMIEKCEAGGSCLPQSGLFQGGFTAGVMTLRRCTMYLPQGYRDMENPHLLVVLPPRPGSENELAERFGHAFEGQGDVIVLVPQSSGFSSVATDKAANHTILAMEWASNLFKSNRVTLVGLGTSSDAALEASLRRPELCRDVLFDGDKIYEDMVEFSGPKIVEALDSRTNQISYTAITNGSAQTRLALVLEAMSQEGFDTQIYPVDGTELPATWVLSWFFHKN